MRLRNSLFATVAVVLSGFASTELHAATSAEREVFLSRQRENVDFLFANADQIIGVEAIVAEGSDKAFYSRFGHAMLRFVKADGDFATDRVVSLVADVDMEELDAAKATFGGYRVLPLVRSLGEFWNAYVKTEGRPLSRHVILSNPELRQRLLQTLKAWIDNPDLAGSYTFLNNNCVGALARLLQRAGFPSEPGIDPKIPMNMGVWLNRSFLSPFPALQVESAKVLFDRMSGAFGIRLGDIVEGRNWPADSAETLMREFDDLAIKRMLIELPNMPYDVRRALIRSHNFRDGGATLEEVMSFKILPERLYQICLDDSCVADVVVSVTRLWSPNAWKDALREDDFSYWLALRNHRSLNENEFDWVNPKPPFTEEIKFFPRSLRKVPEILRFYQMLLRSQMSLL